MSPARPGLFPVLIVLADIPLFWGLAELFAGPLLLDADQLEQGGPWVLLVAGALLQAPFAQVAIQSRKR
jgi:hypothetical protein